MYSGSIAMGGVMTDEASVQAAVRLEASRRNWMVWRNNSGAGKLNDGRMIRWGLANESERINKVIKSSDLIGLMPVTITQDMIGQTVGVFTALECKRSDWKGFPTDDRERAQERFLQLVRDYGGIGRFINDPEQL